MKKTLTTNEINEIVADTIERIEAKKGTNTVPYIQMDLSVYSFETLEELKKAFIASNVRFEDRWNNGSDFVVEVPVESAPGIFRSGRRDAFTKSDGPICEPGRAKKPLNLGRRDAFTVDPRNPMHKSVHVPKKSSHLGGKDTDTVSDLIADATERSEAAISTGGKEKDVEKTMD